MDPAGKRVHAGDRFFPYFELDPNNMQFRTDNICYRFYKLREAPNLFMDIVCGEV
jgi:hypothetical protein